MSKTLREAPLTTRAARAKLAVGLHWRSVSPEVHLGYRRGARGGNWVVRWRVHAGGYRQTGLGAADDFLDADEVTTLSFAQAMRAARDTVETRRLDAAAQAAGPVPTVASAVDDYCREQEKREAALNPGKSLRKDARSRLNRYVGIDKQLVSLPLHKLDERDLHRWREGLPERLAMSTVRRAINDFKAALNAAARRHRAQLPAHIPIVIRNGLASVESVSPVARTAQILPDSDIRRLISAAKEFDLEEDWGGDLARLIITLAATGARYSQIIRMRVMDVQPDARRLMIPMSRKGRARKTSNYYGVRVGDDVIAEIKPALDGRMANEELFQRWRWKQVSPTKWERDRRGAWRPSDLARPWHAITSKAGFPTNLVPYAFRHSSIVRGLRANLPVRLVASLHDTSSAMIEAHYSAYIIDALDELSAAAVIPLAPATS